MIVSKFLFCLIAQLIPDQPYSSMMREEIARIKKDVPFSAESV